MAEVTIPEEEIIVEEVVLPVVEMPSLTSKVISVNFNPLNTKVTTNIDTHEGFFTTDTDAWIVFNIADMSEPTGEYSIALINKEDGSIFQHVGDIVKGVAYYKLLQDEIRHGGRWTGQAIVTLENGKTTASKFNFNVTGHILDGKDVREIVIQDFQTLMAQLNSLKDVSETDLNDLLLSVETAQAEYQANSTAFDQKLTELSTLIETDVVGLAVDEKYGEMEATYATDLTNLKTSDESITAQLAQIDNKVYTKNSSKTKPLVTFYMDDAPNADYDIVYPYVSGLGVPMTICVYNTSQLIRRPNDLNEMVENGWEIHGHNTEGESLIGMTKEEMRSTMGENKSFLENLGYKVDGYCYPTGYTDETALKVAREFFTVGMGSEPGINTSPIDTYFVKRYLTDSGTTVIKQAVDKIIADGTGWVVIYAHSGQFTTYPQRQVNFFEMIDYCIDKGVEIATVGDAMKTYSNTLDIGDIKYSGDYTKIGSDGKITTSQIPSLVGKSKQVFNTIQGTSFPSGVITVDKFGLSTPSDIPFDSGIGTVYTDRLNEAKGLVGSIATQKFTSHKNRIVTRHFQSSVGWSAWVDIGLFNKVSQTVTELTPVSAFPLGQITTVGILSGESPNLPLGGIGTLITDRTGNVALNYQLFLPYRSNAIYKRFWNSSTSLWSEFEKHSISYSTTLPVTYFGNLTSGSSATKDFTVVGLSNLDGVSINLLTPQEGVLYTCSVTATNTLSVRIYNVSSVSINVSLSFVLSVVKR